MAHYHEDIVSIELENGMIHRSFLRHSIGRADVDANRFGIRAYRNGAPVDLSGASCQGFFRNAEGLNIALTSYGTVNGNVAYVTLPAACYNVEGLFTLSIKIVGGGVTSTMRIVDGMVDNTNTSGAVAPTDSVPTYSEIIAQYDAMVEATDVANGYALTIEKQELEFTTLNADINATTRAIASNSNNRCVYAKCIEGCAYTVSKIAGKRFSVGFTTTTPASGVTCLSDGFVVDNEAADITTKAPATAKYIVSYVYNAGQDTTSRDDMLESVTVESVTAKDVFAREDIENLKEESSMAINFGIDGGFIVPESFIEQGAIDSSGVDTDHARRIRTRNIPYKKGETITFIAGTTILAIYWYFYAADGTITSSGGWKTSGTVLTFNTDGNVRIIYKKDDSTSITPSSYDATTVVKTAISNNLDLVNPLIYTTPETIDPSLWETGGIGSAGEDNNNRTTSIRSDFLDIPTRVIMGNNDGGYIVFYSSNSVSNFVKRVSVSAGETEISSISGVSSAKYIRIEAFNTTLTDYDNIEIQDTLQKTVMAIRQEIAGVGYDEYEDKLSQARYVHTSGGKCLTLMHFSDVHDDLSGMVFVRELAKRFGSKLDDVIHTGDAVLRNYDDGVVNWVNSGCAESVINVIGNHDTELNLVLQAAGKDNVYNTFFAPYISGWGVTQPDGVTDSSSPNYHALYYYKDYTQPNVRLIVLDTNFWNDAQKTWLSSVLGGALTGEMCVVVACHDVKKMTSMPESNFSDYAGENINETGNTYANQPDDWLDPVQTFINNGGNFAGIIAGHNHEGNMGYMTNYPDIFCFVSDKASVARTSGTARKSGECNANTVNIVTINPSEKLFKIVKIGAEIDGKMRGKHVFCYDYDNKTIISQW